MKRKLIGAFLMLLLLSGCTAATKPSTEPTTAAKATTPAETASTTQTPTQHTPETTETILALTQAPTVGPTRAAGPPQMQPAAEMPADPSVPQHTQAPTEPSTEPPTEAPQATEAASWDTEEAVAQICADCNAYIVSIGCTADPAAACWVAPQYTHWEGSSAAWLRERLIAGIDDYKANGVTALYVTYEADPRGGFQVYLRYAI